MFAEKPTRKRIAALFALLAVGCMALFFSLYEPWMPIGPERIPDGSFDTPSATNGWTGWSPWAQLTPDGGHDSSAGVILTASTNKHGLLRYIIHDLTEVPAFRVSLRAAAKGITAEKKNYQYPRALFFYKDSHDKPLFHLPHEFFSTQKDKGWRHYEDFFPVPVTATNVQLYIQHAGTAGTLYVDDISVIPVRARLSARWWKLFFGAVWAASFVVCLIVLRLWARRYGYFILITSLLIVTGIVLPGSFLEETTDKATQSAKDLVQQPAKPVPVIKPVPARPDTAAPVKPAPIKSKEEVVIEIIDTGAEQVHLIGHLTLFSLLAFLSALSWLTARPLLKRAGAVFAGLVLFAAATEVLQFITVDRTARLTDLFVDLAGMAVAILTVILLRTIQRRLNRRIA